MLHILSTLAVLSALCFGIVVLLIYIEDGFPFFKDKQLKNARMQRVGVRRKIKR